MSRLSKKREVWVICPSVSNKKNLSTLKPLSSLTRKDPLLGKNLFGVQQRDASSEDGRPKEKSGNRREKMPVTTRQAIMQQREEEREVGRCEDSVKVEQEEKVKKPLSQPRIRRSEKVERETSKKKTSRSHPKKKHIKVKKKKVSRKAHPLMERIPEEAEDEEDTEMEEFEKNIEHDINFVLSKYIVDKNIEFNIQSGKKMSNFRLKMMRTIRRTDILRLRGALQGEEKVFIPQTFTFPTSSNTTATPAAAPRRTSSTGLSTKNRSEPDLQMPVLQVEQKEPRKKARAEAKSKSKVQLKSLDLFRSIKKTSFKIPKKDKPLPPPPPRYVVNGALWQWALTVDDNGQVYR